MATELERACVRARWTPSYKIKIAFRVMVSTEQFTPATTSSAHAPLPDEEPFGRKLADTIG